MLNLGRVITIGEMREIARRRTPEFAFVPMETGGVTVRVRSTTSRPSCAII
jgi:hypothetical protein